MSTFQLEAGGIQDYTGIPNCFIENFMPKAAGEFVKIYIYIIKCLGENKSELSISRIADVFNDTEKDVIRALKYWDKKGLITLTFEEGTLTSLKVNHLPDSDEANRRIVKNDSGTEGNAAVHEHTPEELKAFSVKDDIPLLIYSVQKYMGRSLSAQDMNRIMFFYEDLGFSPDLIEYLFEYCADHDHANIRYIEKTAIAWKESGVSSVNAAKNLTAVYSKECFRVLKAFGLTGRNPSKGEVQYVNRWVFSYGFDIEIILEACERTMNAIHQPSFEYADTILRRWMDSGADTIEKIKEADKEFEKKASGKYNKDASKQKNKFNNFSQREYDWEKLEEELFNLK